MLIYCVNYQEEKWIRWPPSKFTHVLGPRAGFLSEDVPRVTGVCYMTLNTKVNDNKNGILLVLCLACRLWFFPFFERQGRT